MRYPLLGVLVPLLVGVRPRVEADITHPIARPADELPIGHGYRQ